MGATPMGTGQPKVTHGLCIINKETEPKETNGVWIINKETGQLAFGCFEPDGDGPGKSSHWKLQEHYGWNKLSVLVAGTWKGKKVGYTSGTINGTNAVGAHWFWS